MQHLIAHERDWRLQRSVGDRTSCVYVVCVLCSRSFQFDLDSGQVYLQFYSEISNQLLLS